MPDYGWCAWREAVAGPVWACHRAGAPVGRGRVAGFRRRGARRGAQVGNNAHGWDSLTPTELQVAELAAAGRRNADIAATLYMGIATVKTDLGRVFTKTGCTNRSGARCRQARPQSVALHQRFRPSVGHGTPKVLVDGHCAGRSAPSGGLRRIPDGDSHLFGHRLQRVGHEAEERFNVQRRVVVVVLRSVCVRVAHHRRSNLRGMFGERPARREHDLADLRG